MLRAGLVGQMHSANAMRVTTDRCGVKASPVALQVASADFIRPTIRTA